MGLTISYRLRSIEQNIDNIHKQVLALHRTAQDLGFMDVGEITILKDQECTIDMNDDGNDPNLELKVHASEITGIDQDGKFSFRHPSHIIGFTFIPGKGCSMADIGFRVYPDEDIKAERVWTWLGYCKTQYASNPEYGGLENFITSHLKIIDLLDAAQIMGIKCDVTDNGNYWQSRDQALLAKAVNDNNLFTAVAMGAMKDVATSQNVTLAAPILDFPNFEYLEGHGQQRLSNNDNSN
jgi:hypothetical protein